MIAKLATAAFLSLAPALAPRPALADEAAAWAALRAGGHVALMRHAEAPGGVGDPPGFRLDDCATQRNLRAAGREQARAVGERLRAQRVRVEKVLASPWCRCIETAELMGVGPVQVEPTFANAFVLSDRRTALTSGAREVIAAWQGPGTLLIVTHGANIQALTGDNPPEGAVVVVAAAAPGRAIGRVDPPP